MAANSWSSLQNINNCTFWTGKTNSLFNLTNRQLDFDGIYLNVKDPYEAKYQSLINKWESTDLKHLNDCKAFTEYSKDMDDIHKKILKSTIQIKNKNYLLYLMIRLLICLVKTLNPIVLLFIRGRKLKIPVFIMQCYFAVPKNIRLNSTHYCIMKIRNKRELQQIAYNHSSDIDFDIDITSDIEILWIFTKNILQNHNLL